MNETIDHPTIPDNRKDDLHHLDVLATSQLNLFMAGNQFMVMEELIGAFKRKHPAISRIYYQTLPPGLQAKQILAGGARFRGQSIKAAADIYTSVNLAAMDKLAKAGIISAGSQQPYLRNRLVLLVPSGNPAAIGSISDLGLDHVRISQPDPINEDIAFHTMDMYRDAGGHALVERIMESKRAEGTTIMTMVHHRETPLRLINRTVDVGPVWATEAVFARSQNLPVEVVDPGPVLDQQRKIVYYICKLRQAPHPENAELFMNFMATDRARAIYENFGFIPHSI